MQPKHYIIGGLGYCLFLILILGEDALIGILLLPVLLVFKAGVGRLARWITHSNGGYYTKRRK